MAKAEPNLVLATMNGVGAQLKEIAARIEKLANEERLKPELTAEEKKQLARVEELQKIVRQIEELEVEIEGAKQGIGNSEVEEKKAWPKESPSKEHKK